jgi:hypothetical protein
MNQSTTREERDINKIDKIIFRANKEILELIILKEELKNRANLRLIQGGSIDARPFQF